MPRQRRSAPVRTQTRSAHTAAAPVAAAPPHSYPSPVSHPAPVQTQQGPGLFGQMASTAAGVAVGSAVGHTLGAGITSMFGGSSAPAAPVEAQPLAAQSQQSFQEEARTCDADAKLFTKCLEDNSGNMQICDYYLQQLKACQEASRRY